MSKHKTATKSKKCTEPMNANTQVKVLEERLDVDFGVNPSMRLDTFFKLKGYPVLSQLLTSMTHE